MNQNSFLPPSDPVFQHLLSEAAVSGVVAVYGIVVSPGRLVAFDPTFQPEKTEQGAKIVEAIISAWRNGRPVQPWVYPRGDVFVVSDDYFCLAAIREGQPESIACQCLGEPKSENVYSAEGPLPLEWVRQSLGVKVED
jgi:hypothetical protein